MRLGKSISVLMLALAVTTPAGAAARHGAALKAKQPAPASPLAGIQVLGDRPAPFAMDARAALLVDGHSGAVLYAHDQHLRMEPASLAKIMTFYITLGALKDGRLTLGTPVTISEKAWRLSMDQTVSKMFLEVGQQVEVRELLYGLMVSSGNDAAMALAEYLGGSSEGFVAMMNDEVRKLGLRETHFTSPDGLPMPDEYTTAADMVKLARIVIEHFPDYSTYTAVKEYTFHKIEQPNWNRLLFYDSRVDGLKTGHVAEAGFHLVATARSGDTVLIAALMGAPNAEKRRTETEKLLDWGFRSFTTITPDWHHAVAAQQTVYEGTADSVPIAPRLTAITVDKGEEQRIKLEGKLYAPYLVAPVRKGTRVGELRVEENGKTLLAVPVQTEQAVARGGFVRVLIDKMRLLWRRIATSITSKLRSFLGLGSYFKS